MAKRIKQFFFRQRAQPFAVMLGFFFAYAGISGLINVYLGKAIISITTIGYKSTILLNISFMLSGLGMFFGIGLNKPNIEAFGLIMVATSLIVRSILSIWLTGINNPNIIILNLAFVFSCIIKLMNLIKLIKSKEVLLITE